MNRQIDGLTDGQMNRLLSRLTYRQMDVRTDRWTSGRIDGLTDSQMNRRIDGLTDGQMDGQTGRWTGSQSVTQIDS
jgi:hypothetical protein